jgi:hypothetical protein
VASKYLAPYLAARKLITLPLRDSRVAGGLDVRIPLTWQERHGADVLGLAPLDPIRG